MSASAEEVPKTLSQFRRVGFLGIALGLLTSVLWMSGWLRGFRQSRDPNLKVIAGMSADDLMKNLAERGFHVEKNFQVDKAICKRDRYSVEIDGLSDGVSAVVVTIEADASSADGPFAFDDRKLMGYVASTSFTDAHTSENIHWAELHFDDATQRIDGQTVLETKKEATKRVLIMRPAEQTTKQ